MAKRRSARQKHRSGQAFIVSVVLIVVALAGGIFAAVTSNRQASGQIEKAQAAEGSTPFYREVSIATIADVIGQSEHSLVYFRSPT